MATSERNICVQVLERLGEFLQADKLLPYLAELEEDTTMLSEIEMMVKNEPAFETKTFSSIFELRLYRIVLYALVRAIRPELFLETGVLHGLTSYFLLRALEKNGSGNLCSIDLPSYADTGPCNRDGHYAILPPGREPGWIVPNQYWYRWELTLGTSEDRLPEILLSHNEIDIFLHDSEHTYETVWFELNQVWPKLRANGVLICDNIRDSAAFFDFCKLNDRDPFLVPYGSSGLEHVIRFGIVKK